MLHYAMLIAIASCRTVMNVRFRIDYLQITRHVGCFVSSRAVGMGSAPRPTSIDLFAVLSLDLESGPGP